MSVCVREKTMVNKKGSACKAFAIYGRWRADIEEQSTMINAGMEGYEQDGQDGFHTVWG